MTLFKNTARALALAMGALGLMVLAPISAAQSDEMTSRQFSAASGEIVLEAQKFISQDNFSQALQKLSAAENLPELTPYERAVIAQMQGASFYQLGQFGPAIDALERAIAARGFTPDEAQALRVQRAQIMIGNGQFAAGAEALERHVKSGGNETPEFVKLLSQAWVQAEQYERALPWAEKEFAAARPKERRHFNTLNFLYSNLEMPERQSDLVKEMISRWPNEKPLWDAWASLLSQSGRDEDAFEVSKMLYLGGALAEEEDIRKVVQYYAYYDMPYQAAQILEKEMNAKRVVRQVDKLVQLSSLFRQAREYARAIPILEEATEKGGSGDLFAQLGEALYNEGQCSRAEAAFREAIERGYDAAKAWMLIGACRYEEVQQQEKLSCKMSDTQKSTAAKTKARRLALAAFENVPNGSTQRRGAEKWISFIRGERQTFDNRCRVEIRQRQETCFIDIQRAYAGEFINGRLNLGDPNCESFIPEYDRRFRVKTAA